MSEGKAGFVDREKKYFSLQHDQQVDTQMYFVSDFKDMYWIIALCADFKILQ